MTQQQTPLRLAAHIISDLFAPLLVPTYAMLAAMFMTPLAVLHLSTRLWATAGVFVITAVIPFALIWTLIKLGKVSDASISDRSQRTIPYIASILCYAGAAIYLACLRAPQWLWAFFVGAALVSVFSVIITRWWKISAHVGAVGGLCAGFFWLAWHHMLMYAPLLWVCVSMVLVCAMAWARLYLNRHTPLQTLAGAALGFFTILITLSV